MNLSSSIWLLLAQCVGTKRPALEEADVLIQKTAHESEVRLRPDAIPGIRPLTATALIAANGNGATFCKGGESSRPRS